MSMLAERRRKTRYVINPTRKPLWTTDSSGIKFGKELMEKMGWSAGKGLGTNEQGIQEPLRVSYKNDKKGMGFKGNDENWIGYQDEFNSLLNQLASNADNKTHVEKNEVMSLEEKSKLSKARVHYQKFTRGKDLSKYSENDLSCILGTIKMKKNNEETIEKEAPPDNNTYETSFGVTTINSGSIKDYFKKKWTLNNSKSENSNVEKSQNGFEEEPPIGDESKEVERNKSKKRHKESMEDSSKYEYGGEDEDVEKETKKHKKKRKKLDLEEDIPSQEERTGDTYENDVKSGTNEESGFSSPLANVSNAYVEGDVQSKKKKKQKRRSELQEIEPVMAEEKDQIEASIYEKIKTKRNKKEKKSEELSIGKYDEEVTGYTMEEPENETLIEDSRKRKKRKTEKRAEELSETFNNPEIQINGDVVSYEPKKDTEIMFEEKLNKKKKKKEKDREVQIEPDELSQFENAVEEQIIKKKKKKKEKEAKDFQREFQNTVEYFVPEVKKKSKKMSEENIEELITGDFLGVEETNQLVEEKSVEKKKKKKTKGAEESKLKEEEKSMELPGREVLIEDALTEKKKKKSKNEENSELELCQTAEGINKSKKNKKKIEEETENRDDQVEVSPLESEGKVSKKKKHKTKTESEAVDTSETLKEIESYGISDNKEEKERKNEGVGSVVESGEIVIHTHKKELFQMKKPFLDGNKKYSTAKAVRVICGAEIENFKGSNLGNIPGYGSTKIKNNEER